MTTDQFRHHDAAYVLGALDEADRRAFEAHLEICAECRANVAEARNTADLLSGLTAADVADVGPMPDTMLPGLLRKASRERGRGRVIVGSLTAVAAAAVTVLVVALWPTGSPAARQAQAFAAVRPNPVTATAELVSRSWGTEINLRCRYEEDIEHYTPYALVVIDKDGRQHAAGSWKLIPGHTIEYTGGTSVPRGQIAELQITRSDGTPILELDL